MAGPSLFDLSVTTGLQPIGELLNPSVLPYGEYDINYDGFLYNKFIDNNFDSLTTGISASKHVAFLTFWLNAFIFCTISLQVSKVFAHLAGLIHEGVNFSFSKLFLAYFYDSIADVVESLQAVEDTTNVRGPLWILQL